MGKTIDTSELLYRMGKYAEINIGEESHDSFMHFMHLLTRTIEKMPNTGLDHKNPISDEIIENQYKLVNAISMATGRTRNDGWYPTWIGMTMKIVRLKSGESAGFRYIKDNEGHDYPGVMHTSCVVDYYISDDKKNVIVQTENTVYKFEKIEED